MPYTPRIFRDKPDRSTPITAEALAHMQTQHAEAVADAKEYTDSKVQLVGRPGAVYHVIAGSIRYVNATTWALIQDTNHQPTGLASVQYMSDRLRVFFDFETTKVGGINVGPDETMATVSGIRMGSSVGTTYFDIQIYTGTSSTPIDPNTLTNTSANIWITGFMEVVSP